MDDKKVDQWHWEYIEPKGLKNFYRIWDNENNTIAHFELPASNDNHLLVSKICDAYNKLTISEALWQWAKR